jgi:predicted benzoate:H+ symporter BenE
MKLVDDAKDWSKWWSVRLSILGGAILTFMDGFPNALSTVVNTLPHSVTSNIDADILRFIGIACIIASPIARVIKQSRLDNQGDRTDKAP